jgi:hypothetical protein
MKQHLPPIQQHSVRSNTWNSALYTFRKWFSRTIILLFILISSHSLYGQDLSNIGSVKPLSYSGGINLTGISYSASGIANRRQPFTYIFSGDPTFNLYGISIPLSFTLSQADRSFRQPFNEFGMSPTYKWITVHAGYRSINFSPYTLGGYTMLGGGVELNPGKLRVGFMYGRLNRATTIDTTTQTLVPFSFSRKGFAAKVGYGSQKNFFELSYLSAKDDSTTAPSNIPPLQQLSQLPPTPAKNNVLGYHTGFSFLKKFTFESDGAISLYTTDMNSTLSLDSITNPFLKKVKNLFGLNASSEYYTALSGMLGYRSKGYGLKVAYKRIEPDFKTMGAYYFNSDIENWTFSPNATLFKNKFRFNGSVGIQHDNLRQQKRAQNKRFIGNANASFEFTEALGMDVIYSNFSDNQQPRTAQFADSLRIVQTTQTIGITPRYFIIKPDITHSITASVNHSSLNDFNNYFSDQAISRNISTNQYYINYTVSLPKKMLSMFLNLNQTTLSGQGMNSKFTGATIGGNTAFFNQKLQTGLTATFTQSSGEQSPSSFLFNGSGNLRYQVNRKQICALNVFINTNKAKAPNLFQPNFTETRAELSYQFNF